MIVTIHLPITRRADSSSTHQISQKTNTTVIIALIGIGGVIVLFVILYWWVKHRKRAFKTANSANVSGFYHKKWYWR